MVNVCEHAELICHKAIKYVVGMEWRSILTIEFMLEEIQIEFEHGAQWGKVDRAIISESHLRNRYVFVGDCPLFCTQTIKQEREGADWPPSWITRRRLIFSSSCSLTFFWMTWKRRSAPPPLSPLSSIPRLSNRPRRRHQGRSHTTSRADPLFSTWYYLRWRMPCDQRPWANASTQPAPRGKRGMAINNAWARFSAKA